jgi:predicted transcriptional regulator
MSLNPNIQIFELNCMAKQQYRSEMGVISDILRVTMECGRQGKLITSIAREANLSRYTAIEKSQKLVDVGLMESVIDKRNRTYIITEKGLHFFQKLQNFLEMVKALKIRF